MTIIPEVLPPLPTINRWDRALEPADAFGWLAAGWRDFVSQPAGSIAYGFTVFLASVAIVLGLYALGADYILFPALAGFLVIGPLMAVGLYEKSRRLQLGEQATLGRMLLVRPRSGGQILFAGLLLCLLMMLWLRAAVLIYALFFGLLPFPGLDHIAPMLFTTGTGWAMLVVGSAVGGLFAAFAFAISVFAIPMLLEQPVDALTAMGSSFALVWNNLRTMLTWAAIVLALVLACFATAMLGMIVIFPVLGHATWHAYRAVAEPAA